ncbi:BNR-4 repeat-containing protein [Micromonospora sp. M12]
MLVRRPRGVYYDGDHRRTYLGLITANGEIRVTMYDHETERRTTSVVTTGFQIDDHNNPAIVIRPDRRVVVFWSGHGGSAMYYRRSARPEDVTAWEPIKQVPTNTTGGYGYTYPNPVQLSGRTTGCTCSGAAETSTRPTPPPTAGTSGPRPPG